MWRRSLLILTLSSSVGVVACAVGSSDGDVVDPNAPAESSSPSIPMPGGTGFDQPSSGASSGSTSSSSSSTTSSTSSSTSSTSSGGSTSGGSSTSSSSGTTSSSSSSSSGTTSSSSSTSGGTSGGACGVCDRDWTCNNFTDPWVTQGANCVNTRTSTTLKCNGKFDQGTSVNVGTWSGNATKLTLVYPMLGGGTKTYDCFP